MKIILSAAMSCDGYLDDASPARRIFSCPKDLKEVEKIRAAADAILVGAGTIRKDNPSLITRDEKLARQRTKKGLPRDPVKVTITKSGNLDPDFRFFRDGDGEKIVYCAGPANEALQKAATLVRIENLPDMLKDLDSRGVKTLLVEGGAKILSQFLQGGLYDEFRLAIAPGVMIGDSRAPSLCRGMLANAGRAIAKEECGDMEVIHFVPPVKT